MSDLRDFTPDSAPRFVDSPLVLDEPTRQEAVFVDDGGLNDLHIKPDTIDEGAGRSKLFAGLAVALMFGTAGAFAVSQFMKDQPVVADNSLASPSAPARTAAMTPPAPIAAPAPEAMAPSAPEAMAPAAPDVVKPAPVTRQANNTPRVMPAPRSSDTSTAMTAPVPAAPMPSAPAVTPAPAAPVQDQAANVPEPVAPAPPASALAGNPALNEQSAQSPDDAVAPPAAAQPEAAQPAAPAPAPAEPAAPAQ